MKLERVNIRTRGTKPSIIAGYFVVACALLNPILRPSVEVPITLYYLLSPLFFSFFLVNKSWFRLWIALFCLLAGYGLIAGLHFGVPPLMQVSQLIKHLQLLSLFALLKWLIESDTRAPYRLWRLLTAFTSCIFVFATIQQFTGIEIPTVKNETSHLWLSTFFYTPNDLALFLGGMACLVLSFRSHWTLKLIFLGAAFALCIRNDARAILLALIVISSVHLLTRLARAIRVPPILLYLSATFAFFFSLQSLYMHSTIGDDQLNLAELFADPLYRIVHLEPYGLGGSVFDRTDALIHSIEAARSVNWLGLGPAGSVYTLSLPQYSLLTAQSLHNAIPELLLEFGPPALLLSAAFFAPVLLETFRTRISRRRTAQILLIASAPLLSVSQSSGYISNYAFWTVAFLAWTFPFATRRQPLPPHKPPVRPRSLNIPHQ